MISGTTWVWILRRLIRTRRPDAYRQSIRLDPKNADAHVNLGRLYQLEGDLKHAKRHYELALTARPGHQLAYYNLGTVFDELDEVDKAADFYAQAPGIPDAHYNLARIRELQGDEVSALRHMRKLSRFVGSRGRSLRFHWNPLECLANKFRAIEKPEAAHSPKFFSIPARGHPGYPLSNPSPRATRVVCAFLSALAKGV